MSRSTVAHLAAPLTDARDRSLLPLTPSQAAAFKQAMAIVPGASVVILKGDAGVGKSLIVDHLRAQLGGSVHRLDEVLAEIARRAPGNIEEAIVDFLSRHLQRDRLVFVEDLPMFDALGAPRFVDRPAYLTEILAVLYDRVISTGGKLVITSAQNCSENNRTKANLIEIDTLAGEDYLAIVRNLWPGDLTGFDCDRVARAYKKLSGHQIRAVVNMLIARGKARLTAEEFAETLDRYVSRSNLVVEDVEAVNLDELVGIDSVVRELMRTIIIPMTQPDLARELGLRPARGVLLHGEPGTGKTTIGRALARQMKGKFFIMDGSTPPGPKQDALLAAAEASSPSVFFIDDADVIFRNGENSGFARKLLTKLDGLESESIGNVCIIMTAMDVADMPPAVVRSGRVEVWLHMELPDARKRTGIIQYYASSLPEPLRVFNDAKLIEATEGFTPADLRGLVGDARGHLAYDRHKGRAVKSFEEYLLLASSEIQERKDVLAALSGKPGRKQGAGEPAARRVR